MIQFTIENLSPGRNSRLAEAVQQAIAGTGKASTTVSRPSLDAIHFSFTGTEMVITGTNSYVAVKASVPLGDGGVVLAGPLTPFTISRPDFKELVASAKNDSLWSLDSETGVLWVNSTTGIPVASGVDAPRLDDIFAGMAKDTAGGAGVRSVGISEHVLVVLAKVAALDSNFKAVVMTPGTGDTKPISVEVGRHTIVAAMPCRDQR